MSTPIFEQNYFAIFSLEPGTELDLIALKETNRTLQQQYHPDRFAGASDAQKREAMQVTSLINQAFDTLQDPVTRLQYLLALKGLDMNAETDTSMDGVFLMEQMELREEIADVRQQADPLDVLDTIAAELKTKVTQLTDSFAQLYQDDELQKCREIVRKLQFINKAQREVRQLVEQLEDELI